MTRTLVGLAPALLLALFGAWCGTFAWGATSAASATAAVSLLGTIFWIGAPWRDPLRLGTAGRLLPAGLWLAATASAWASPVPRAGRVAILLLPAFLGLPAAMASCWRRESDRRVGLRALALVVAGVSLWALVDWWFLGSPRPAMPLGHHNLLAAWLVILLPLAVLPARETGPWRLSGLAAVSLALLAILASRSLAGFAALGLEALVGFGIRGSDRQRRGWAVLLALALLVSFLQVPRALRVLTGQDPSARARISYLQAGWTGFMARPILGWGPGSAAWTSAAFLDPVPGVNPWGEAVGELHSLPLQLAYELGITGLLLALAIVVLFFARRMVERQEGRDPALLAAGLLGLGGGAIASLGSGALAVTALPVAAVVAAGAALAGSGRGKARPESPWPVRLYAVAALFVLAPLELAHWRYDRAAAADIAHRSGAESELAEAIRLDPDFPLYPVRLALLRGREPEDRAQQERNAELARHGAEIGRGVPSLWLISGVLGYSAHLPWAGAALDKACRLDLFNPFPPFYRLLAEPGGAEAPAYGAHALLAEPRLAAATFWQRHPALLGRTLEAVRVWPAVDYGWKQTLFAAVPPLEEGGAQPVDWLALEIDTQGEETLSLPVFRRRPWPASWRLVQVRAEALSRLSQPSAATVPGASAWSFAAVPCRRRSPHGQDLLTR
ncbi:MAG: putative inorganic carbon ((-)) transporter [Acidobacteriota bacterium]|jgi:O-antigen ligase|nr:putative inorganic carbon ((-)) transporter [Acidobacteriota bacterium]